MRRAAGSIRGLEGGKKRVNKRVKTALAEFLVGRRALSRALVDEAKLDRPQT